MPAFVNWTPAREKRPGPAVRAPRFVGEAAPGVLGVLGVWALGLGEKGVCWVALFCGVVDILVGSDCLRGVPVSKRPGPLSIGFGESLMRCVQIDSALAYAKPALAAAKVKI